MFITRSGLLSIILVSGSVLDGVPLFSSPLSQSQEEMPNYKGEGYHRRVLFAHGDSILGQLGKSELYCHKVLRKQ